MKKSTIAWVVFSVAAALSIGIFTGVFIQRHRLSAANLTAEQVLDSVYRQMRTKTDFVPEIALVLGSGLGDIADFIDIQGIIPYGELKDFPVSTASGHIGQFVYGTLAGKKVICMQGRIHHYEGYTREQVVLPIRLMRLMGAKTLFITNAAGGINASYQQGDLMLLTDHISLFVENPLIGSNIESLGDRFPDLSEPYDAILKDAVRDSAKKLGISLREGVYAQVNGPSYESQAESRYLRQIGADAVGMSTVVETIAARHGGMRVCAISVITNQSFDVSGHAATEQEVIKASEKAAVEIKKLLFNVFETI